MIKVLIGTRNETRSEYVKEILKELPIEIVNLSNMKIYTEVEEDGNSPIENSIKKALTYYKESIIPTLSIDTGLYIDKFPKNKQPGVYVKRIKDNKQDATDIEMLDYYISELKKYGGESKGCWKIALTLVISEDNIFTSTFDRNTKFTYKRCREFNNGEPLNSIQIDDVTNKYLAQLSSKEKKQSQVKLANHIYDFIKKNLVNNI